ncbi:MAG: ATP cone domain-containing protein [Parabacteroides distasonis]
MVEEVENFVRKIPQTVVSEQIQVKVEQSLMEHGFYAEAKNYILYRWQRTERRKSTQQHNKNELGDGTVMDVLKEIRKTSPPEYNLVVLYEKFSGFANGNATFERLAALIKAAVERPLGKHLTGSLSRPVYSISNYRRNWKQAYRQASVRFTTNCAI